MALCKEVSTDKKALDSLQLVRGSATYKLVDGLGTTSHAVLAREIRPLVVINILARVSHGSEALVQQVILDEIVDFLGVLLELSFVEGIFVELLDGY